MLRKLNYCLLGLVAVLANVAIADDVGPTLGIATGPFGSTDATLGQELVRAVTPDLDGEQSLQVRTILSRGSQQNIEDLLTLPGVDFAFINTDAVVNLALTKPDHPALTQLSFLTKITDAELHLLVRRDGAISNIDDLANARVSFGQTGSGTALTARLILSVLKIQTTGVYLPPDAGLVALRDGKIDAMFIVGAMPIPILQTVSDADQLTLLSVPYSTRLSGVYDQADISNADYPNLAPENSVQTLSVPVVLAGRQNMITDSDAYAVADRFARVLATAIPRLQKPPYHPKWSALDLDAPVAGWQRHSPFAGALVTGDVK